MDDTGPELSQADRRAIAEIRGKLDAEFQQSLDARFGPLEEPTNTRRHRAGYRGVIATVALGMLAATVLGVAWVRYPDRDSALSDAPVTAQDVEPMDRATVTPWVAVDEVALLQDALDDWIEATRRGDIATQMRFYPARVPVYYTWRNVPREAVRAEKDKVLGAASRLVINTGQPAVELAADGRTAITRFRKHYIIEGPAVRRRGEVLQELRWTRTTDGWVIVGERDARVLRSS